MEDKNYLYNLTPLRGIAALLTVLYHLNLGSNFLISPTLTPGFDKLYLMVDFFFILSGFIMVHVYAHWFENGFDKQTFKKFTVARFARVYPLHFFTLLYLIILQGIYFGLGGNYDTNPFAANSFTWQSIPTNLLLIHSMNIHDWFTWNNASWSISTEWWAYMLFPFMAYAFAKWKRMARWLVIIVNIVGYFSIIFYFQTLVTLPEPMEFIRQYMLKTLNVSYQYGFLRCLFGFVIGMMTYKFYKEKLVHKFLANRLAFFLLACILFTLMHLYVLDVYIVLIFPFILLSAAYGNKSMNSFFETKPLQKLGDLSFAIYLVHQPLIYTRETIEFYLAKNAPPPAVQGPPPGSYLTHWLIAIIFVGFTLLISCTLSNLIS